MTSRLSANGWAVTQGPLQGPLWRRTQVKMTLSEWFLALGNSQIYHTYYYVLNIRKISNGTYYIWLLFLTCGKTSGRYRGDVFACKLLVNYVEKKRPFDSVLFDRTEIEKYWSEGCLFPSYHSGGTESAWYQSFLMLMWEKHLVFN